MELTQLIGHCGTGFVVGAGSGLVPAVNTEAYLLLVAAFAPREALLPVLACVTLGHMAAKALLYAGGCGAASARLAGGRAARLAGLQRRLGATRTGGSALVFTSALTGVPPFYLVSVAAGALRFSLTRFLVLGGSGRLLRFAAVVAVPGWLGAGQ